MRRFATFILLFMGSLSLPSAVFGSSGIVETPVASSCRDSLLRRIWATGSASNNCYLSYPLSSWELNPNFGNNAKELATLSRFLRLSLSDSLLIVRSITLNGYCSPEGSDSFNTQLADNRARHLCHYLNLSDPYFRRYPQHIRSYGADWQGFRLLIACTNYRWSEKALEIIDSPLTTARKKIDIAALDNGAAHKLIYDLYPMLRRVEVRVDYDVQAMQMLNIRPVARQVPPIPRVTYLPPTSLASQEAAATPATCPARQRRVCHPLFALKTNLLFDAALAPNVELEVPIAKRWSLLGEYTFPWWLKRDNSFCYEMLQVGIEGRYWLGNRQTMPNGQPRTLFTGWFAGVYTAAGYYDFQFQHSYGYQGEFYIAAGASGGYALRLVHRLNLEFSLGVGWLTTKYRSYDVERTADRTELVRNSYGRFQWLGPTKAKVSLVWLLGNRKRGSE